MADKQKTLKEPFSITGVGLHTGKEVTMTVKPAPTGHWYQFKRMDVEGTPLIPADVSKVVETERGTTLEENGHRVSTIEHLLAALYGMEIDNALIELDGPEVPILDGSSKIFVDAINSVGIEEQDADKDYFVLDTNITFEDEEKRVEMLAVPAEDFRITVMVDYNSPLLGTQHASMYHIGEFEKEFANCRTFCFLREVEMLFKNGLIKGGDVDNAIVMVDREISEQELQDLAKLVNKPALKVEGLGMLNNVKLHHENEPARHKLLDIVGDLALFGQPIKGHILAARPGHNGNVQFAALLKKHQAERNSGSGRFDLTKEPVYDAVGIKKLLPHRHPFLLVDKILELSQQEVVGIKNVTYDEYFFNGHFPDNPIMPGVLIIEAMAQTGGVLVLNTVPDPENYETYFMKIDKAKFKKMVVPGDTLVMHLELITPIRRGICHMKAQAFVQDQLVAEGELMAQVVKVKHQNESATSTHSS